MTPTAEYGRGEIIGADFEDRQDGRIVLWIAVPDTLVRHEWVVITPSPNDGSGT